MKILTAEQLREIDRLSTVQFGIPSILLMENAGMRVVEVLEERFENLHELTIGILCGRGNNGGDGFVVARQLIQKGVYPFVYLFANEADVGGDARINLDILKAIGSPPTVVLTGEDWEKEKLELLDSDIIIDALLGTGVTKPISGLYEAVVSSLEDVTRATVVAVDLPSGLPANEARPIGPAVEADITVTFTALKPCLVLSPANELAGDVIVSDIGNPEELLESPDHLMSLIDPSLFVEAMAPRNADANKGDYGKVLVVAGSRGKSGAAAMSGQAALKSGAGLVTVATAAGALPGVAASMPELMTEPLKETAEGSIAAQDLKHILEGKTVLAIGPGLTTNPETSVWVRSVLREAAIPTVVDADALNALASGDHDFSGARAPLILTPHPGEMARLAGCGIEHVLENRVDIARDFARAHGVYVVLKGYRTIIASPNGAIDFNPTGNPGMATGGTGDILTGMIAGILAQPLLGAFIDRLRLAVYLHGLAGDLAAAEIGEEAMTATDILRFLPQAWREVRGKSAPR